MANTIKDLINQGYTVEQIAAMAEKEAAAKKASEENFELARARKTAIKAAIDYMIILGVLDAEDIKPGDIDQLNEAIKDAEKDILEMSKFFNMVKRMEGQRKSKTPVDKDKAAIEDFLKNLLGQTGKM